ncbi:hypothetical protein P4639_21985 [Priestia megaterium]|uniref:hypothetical protein n=1 Tax=Priestia megaterium TaxID=1404 RepID=UPI002E1F7505|nr:hypothetical protein [Priestia megaterium]
MSRDVIDIIVEMEKKYSTSTDEYKSYLRSLGDIEIMAVHMHGHYLQSTMENIAREREIPLEIMKKAMDLVDEKIRKKKGLDKSS